MKSHCRLFQPAARLRAIAAVLPIFALAPLLPAQTPAADPHAGHRAAPPVAVEFPCPRAPLQPEFWPAWEAEVNRDRIFDFYAKQAEVVAAHIAKQDVVVTTALVQGRKAPILVTAAMVESMKPGSIIVDIASDAGGNCALTVPGELITTPNGVKILGYTNWPGRIPAAASALYARNLLTFLTTFWDKDAKAPKLSPEDDIVKGTALTRDGAVVHPNLAPAAAA